MRPEARNPFAEIGGARYSILDSIAMSDPIKLYIPGPINVSEATYAAMAEPMIGHRSKDFQDLYADVQPLAQDLFETENPVFLSTSSAWGVMEGAIRNLVGKKVLNCCNGAFSGKWTDVAKRCGKEAEALEVEWGQPITPEALDSKLASGDFDTVTLVHNETSTGVLNPLEDLAEVLSEYPEVCSVVDTVSSFTTTPTRSDELGIDVMLTGSQKALALPPGLALFTVSERAFARAEKQNDRGYYFDFLEFKKNHEKNMTPSTPSIALIYALRAKLHEIHEEGIENRFARHTRLNDKVHGWVKNHGYEFFAPEGYRSKSLTCVKNNKGTDIPQLIKLLRENHSLIIDGGYGKVKGKTFRISNMGDETDASMDVVLNALDDSLARLG